MSPRRSGRLAIAGCAVLCVAGLFVTIAWFRFAGSAVAPRGSISMRELELPVTVHVDTFGIPCVFAAGERDLARGLGYMHAADRLWQMEFFRRVAAGRLSEVFGADLLPTDRFLRTMGLWQAAARAAEALDPGELARLEAYAEGVNRRLESRTDPLPPEYAILRVRPEPWDVVSSLAVGMVMNLDLSHWRRDLSRFWAARNIGPRKAAYLSLGYPEWGVTILDAQVRLPAGVGAAPDTTAWTPAASAGRQSDPRSTTRGVDPRLLAEQGPLRWQAFDLLESVSARSASNSWVISGRRTASGHPILANDMHLALRAPAIWYLAALHADSADYHAVGFTLPGVPGIVVGHNRAMAWGFTNGMVDDMDFAVERSSDDGRSYLQDGEWVEYDVRVDTIRVRGADPEVIRVRHSRRGPIVSDALPGLAADLSAVWVAARTDGRATGLWDMNRAPDTRSMDLAIREFAQPHQNVVFASTDGTIAYRLGGRIPLREGWDGSIPVEASTMGDGFRGFWPSARHPAGRDPFAGFFATANNLQARGLGSAVSTDYASPFRAQRISDVIRSRRDWSIEAVQELQGDTHSLLADRMIEFAIRTADETGRREAAETLRGWDRKVDRDSRGAPLFYSWFYRLRSLVAADEYAAGPGWSFFPLKTFFKVLEEGDGNPWVDDVTTPEVETLAGLSARALDDAIGAVGDATWGELHRERHSHPLGRNAWVQRLLGLDIGPYPAPGAPNTVRPDDYRKWDALDSTSWSPPWLSEYGPSERFVVELAPEGPSGWFLIPTGQSGNPFSSHYRDLNERWRAGGEFVEIPIQAERSVMRSVRRFQLVPRRPRSEPGPETEP